ncbi:MAG: 6-phosphogluconolactonase [Myxococcales bacterium]
METSAYADAESVAQRAAAFIAWHAHDAIASRGQFTLALSGGKTPWRMLDWWVLEDLPWERIHLFQVDERVAPLGDEQRNWTHMQKALQPQWQQLGAHVYPMPVEDVDLKAAAVRYAAMLSNVTGAPAVLDLIHLGLGADGHTASLVPDDPVLDEVETDVALTQPYQGTRRMTLTYPVINRARHILWVAVGEDKQRAVSQLMGRDRSIPAGRVREEGGTLIADFAALGVPH